MPSQIYNVTTYKDGQPVHTFNAQGSCVGVFQFSNNLTRNPDFTDIKVEFGWASNLMKESFCRALANVKLIQALTPGVRYDSERAGFVTYYFPNVADLPADQVATCMRIIKCWTAGYYNEYLRIYEQHELSMDELIPIVTFTFSQGRFSDSTPGLHSLTKAEAAAIRSNLRNTWSLIGEIAAGAKRGRAGMLLPLIRGEINEGWMPPFKHGYFKHGAVLAALFGSDDYNIADDLVIEDHQNVTVNHPVIILNEETLQGPEIPDAERSARYLDPIIGWVQDQLHS